MRSSFPPISFTPPKDPQKGNGSLLLEVVNRGRPRITGLVDGGNWNLEKDAGDAWLLRNGYSVVSLGWQWDAAGQDALRLYAPIARENGRPITGVLRGDLMLAKATDVIPLGHLILGNTGGNEYPVARADDPRNMLTVRDSRDAKRAIIPRSQWQYAQLQDGRLEPSNRHIHLDGGFQPGKIYEYVYVVEDPVVAGLGFAAVRDFASMRSTVQTRSLPLHVFMAKESHRTGVSSAISFIRVSTLMKKGASPSMEFSPTSPEQVAAASTIVSLSLRAMRNRPPRSTSRQISFHSRTNPRLIPLPARREACLTALLWTTSCRRSSSPIRPTSIGDVQHR